MFLNPKDQRAGLDPAARAIGREDRINWRIVREAHAAIPDVFYKAYKALFHSGYHPAAWKTAIGIVLPKRNKPDYSRPKAYRPISLLPCLSKLLEKLFANRLAYLANVEPDLLESSQIGDRKQRSAMDAALLLQHYIEQHHQEKKIITVIFLDILGAFDLV
ncbi:reverse transcriptase (RNA-dependent DNA polymerase) domain-containing protein [Apiospora marii]|uniref:Reverse transcriptase (RNA-dependent DNA polymerase) domain-containing protein n=1 Tax=Apiospora marii TaxID=335849 RepID=A0ABR1RLI4_9PEZI